MINWVKYMSVNRLLNICDKCDNLMSYRETTDEDDTEGLELYCRSCGFKKKSELRGVVISMDQTSGQIEKPNRELQYDLTPYLTKHTVCVNKDCPSIDPDRWGQQLTNGMINQPTVIMTNHFHVDRILTNICNICGTIWTLQ